MLILYNFFGCVYMLHAGATTETSSLSVGAIVAVVLATILLILAIVAIRLVALAVEIKNRRHKPPATNTIAIPNLYAANDPTQPQAAGEPIKLVNNPQQPKTAEEGIVIYDEVNDPQQPKPAEESYYY